VAAPLDGPREGPRAGMWRLIKFLLILAVLAGIALVIYAYVGPFVMPSDFEAPVRDVTQPVDLDVE
jgi:hypothetical protein